MRFNMNDYLEAVRDDCTEKGIWKDHSWVEIFHKLGFSSYKFCGDGGKWHYLSEDEYVIFVLRYSA